MKTATALSVSSVINVALLAVLVARPQLRPVFFHDYFGGPSSARSSALTPSAPVAAANKKIATDLPHFWSTLRSDDLPTLVTRLRAAGFSPQLIRAVVEAQLNHQFAAQLKAIVGAELDRPFWKAETPGMWANTKASEEIEQLYRDRAKKVAAILGDDFFAGTANDPTAAQRRQFGNISKQKIAQLQRISDDYQELDSQVRASMKDVTLPEDREKLALLEREKRADLAAILTPQEQQDYLVRNSPVTQRLRTAFGLMNASEQEFRAVYQVEEPFNDLLFSNLSSGSDFEQRRGLQKQLDDQLKVALGDERFADFTRSTNREFQQLYRMSQQADVAPELAVKAFDLRDSTAAESNRIFGDNSLSDEQKLAALQTLAQTTRSQLIGTLGNEVGSAYAKSANWLDAIERGNSVTFSGSSTSYHGLPRKRTNGIAKE